MFTKEPHAVYPSLLPSTVSSHLHNILRNILIHLIFLDADVCGYNES
jgi:hypothetical protein